MTHRRSITTNMKFIYQDQKKKLRGLLKYFQHRDDRDGRDHIQQTDAFGDRISRWVNRGLGDNHGEILQSAGALATDTMKRNVGARTMVVGPETTLMHAIPEERRVAVLGELTDTIMDQWFERMDLPTPAYAFVAHESQPSDERPDGRIKEDAAGLSYLHTHVVMAATVPGLATEREGYKVYNRHLEMLHEASREAMRAIWEREIGVERYAELQADLEARDRYQRQLDQQAAERELEQDLLDFEAALVSEHQVPGVELPSLDPPEINLDIGTDIGLEIE